MLYLVNRLEAEPRDDRSKQTITVTFVDYLARMDINLLDVSGWREHTKVWLS